MPYAIQEWARMRAVAQDAGFAVQTLRDPQVPDAEWQAALSSAVIAATVAQELSSVALADEPLLQRLGAQYGINHLPTSLVHIGAQWHAWPIYGVMDSTAWRNVLMERLAQLQAQNNTCIPAVSYVPLDAAVVGVGSDSAPALGSYERISPDGRFVLRSYSGVQLGQVSLMELPVNPAGKVRAYRTPFANEAFPVQGTWRYLVDVNGEHYRFADVLAQQSRARALFKAGITGFYAAAAEMPDSENINLNGSPSFVIRSMSWPQGRTADADTQGIGPLQVQTIRVQDDGKIARVVQDSAAQFICTNRNLQDGNVYALPMIAVDGTEFSAIPQTPKIGAPSMKVYGLSAQAFAATHACDIRADLGYSPGKAVFGFPTPATEKQAAQTHSSMLAFTNNASVYFYDRSLGAAGEAFVIDDYKTQVLASAFPGIARDGRIVFAARWRECADGNCPQQAGYVQADPYQSTAYRQFWSARGQAAPKACVTQAEVARVRADFARLHQLSP